MNLTFLTLHKLYLAKYAEECKYKWSMTLIDTA